MRRSTQLIAVVVVVTALVSACGAAAPASPAATQPTTASPAATASAATIETAMPSVDLAHPVGVIAVGHSGLTGEGTGGTYEAVKANSWATGTNADIDSVYQRIVAALPETEGHVANEAVGGATADTLSTQANAALATVPAPALAIIQTVDNDIQCDAANVADVGQSVADVLRLIHDASPNTKILVVGQLGRPSASYIKDLVAHDPTTKKDLTWDDDCTFFDATGTLHEAGFAKLTAAIDSYEAETARVCAAVPNCVTDGGVRRAWVDKIDLFSPDYAHLNAQGQAAEAALIWPVIEKLLGALSCHGSEPRGERFGRLRHQRGMRQDHHGLRRVG